MKTDSCNGVYRLCLGMVAAACMSGPALADPIAAQGAPVQQLSSEQLSDKSDAELTALTARWAELSPAERRGLLAEVRGRMARRGPAATGIVNGPARVVVQRRYGRVVRKSDGRVVVQTQVVEVTPRTGAARGRVTFGIGFEQRSRARADEPAASTQAPAVPVNQTPTPQSQPDASQ